MKPDNQHLDFLISQYVDGCLEGAGKKSVEQQMVNDPDARKLYSEHREVQDLLDDWGNRIPLIDWADFDHKLEARLAQETIDIARRSQWRRWLKPVAAAAALFIAASIGYGWNAWWGAKATPGNVGGNVVAQVGVRNVVTFERPGQTQPSMSTVVVDDATGGAVATSSLLAARVAVGAPEDSAAMAALKDSMQIGLGNISEDAKLQGGAVGASNGVAVDLTPKKDEGPLYP